MARTTVNVYEMEDTYLSSYSSDPNYGRTETLMIGRSVNAPYQIYTILMRPTSFPGTPVGKKVIHISCNLYCKSAGALNANIAILKVLADWPEYEVLYSTRPKMSYQTNAFVTAGTFSS